MPGENVSFVAFGQFHTDEKAFQSVRDKLDKMHTAMKLEGKEMVIGIEHSDVDVRKPDTLARFYNEGLMQKYCDEARARGETPNAKDFQSRHANDMDFRDHGYFVKVDKNSTSRERNLLQRQKNTAMELLFNNHLSETVKDVNVGRGPGRMEEARLLQWAYDNQVPIRGLDPVSDSEKRERLTGGTDRIHDHALEDMEYERVQGMGKNSAAIMKDLSDKSGGCLVAINMGPAHLGSIEVALNDELKNQSLEKAQVKMCVLLPPESMSLGGTPEKISDELMRFTLKDMRGAQSRLENNLRICERDVQTREKTIREMNSTLSRISGLPGSDSDLRKMMRNEPAVVLKMLNHEISDPSLALNQKRIEKALERLDKAEVTDARKALTLEVQNHVQKLEDGLKVSRQELSEAQKRVQEHRDTVMDFAGRVEQRLNNKPGEVYQTCTPGSGGTYDLSGVDSSPRKSVRSQLGIGSPSSSTSVQQDVGVEGSSVSTRSQVKTGGVSPPTQKVGVHHH